MSSLGTIRILVSLFITEYNQAIKFYIMYIHINKVICVFMYVTDKCVHEIIIIYLFICNDIVIITDNIRQNSNVETQT